MNDKKKYKVKLDKGPAEVLRALASGDPEEIQKALEFQRESFKAKFGVDPDDIPWDDPDEVYDLPE